METQTNPTIIDARTAQRLIGLLGLALPVILIGGHLIITGKFLPTLSEYVYTPLGPFFTGILFAIGIMFFAYKGYPTNDGPIPISDNNLANIAGASAMLTAVFHSRTCLSKVCNDISLGACGMQSLGWLHISAAAVTLICMALFCLFYFTQSGGKPVDEDKKRKNKIFRICGYIIVIGLLLALAHILTRDKNCPNSSTLILWLEAAIIWAFSIAWCVKGGIFLKD